MTHSTRGTNSEIEESISSLIRCVCGGSLSENESGFVCTTCGSVIATSTGKVFFTDVPQNYESSGITSTRDHSTWTEWRKKNFEFYKKELRVLPDRTVILDVGIGPGQFDELKERFAVAIGIDFRPFEPVHVVADLTKPMPFKSEVFDCVMISNTLEHIPDTEKILAELSRVLKPGGLFVATIPFLLPVHQNPYDFNRYTHYKLKSLLVDLKFMNIEVRGLSEPVDVFRTVQRHFFTHVIKAPFSRNRILNAVVKLCVRVIWRLYWLLLQLLLPLYRKARYSDDFTEGYGIVARKPRSV